MGGWGRERDRERELVCVTNRCQDTHTQNLRKKDEQAVSKPTAKE